MGLVEESKHVDFSIKYEPWTETELSDSRKLMQELKAKTQKQKERTSVLTVKKKRAAAQ
ncbi:MAG: hypothetical protein QM642_10130 [Edaphocola sp.]